MRRCLLSGNNDLAVWMALRYLLSRTSSLNYVSRLALLGLILSVAVLVIVLSVVNGFERELTHRLLAVLPHVSVEMRGGMPQGEVRALRARDWPGLESFSPYVEETVLLAHDGVLKGATATGIDPATHGQVADIARFTRTQDLGVLETERFSVILGARLAAQLHADVGDFVRVILPAGHVTAAGAIPRQRRMQVVDIFESSSQLDGQTVFLHLDTARTLFRREHAQGVYARLTDLFAVQPARNALQEAYGTRVHVRSWIDRFGNLYRAIAVQKLTMFVLLSFLVAVAAFNLVSGLVMIVEQRKQDVAVLRTLGYGTRGILLLFSCLGMLLAVSGIGLGLGAGSALAAALPSLFEWLTQTLDLNLMSQYIISYLPVDVRVDDIVSVGVAALLMAGVATLFPAWRATRLLPSRVLAHE